MKNSSITATKLKATLLGVLDDVQASGSEVIVTKHGRAVAKLVPVDSPASLEGTVQMLVDEAEFISPLDLEWDAIK